MLKRPRSRNFFYLKQCFCTQEKVTVEKDVEKRLKETHRVKIYQLFKSDEKISCIKEHLPDTLLKRATKVTATNLYLICPSTAKTIADYVFPYIREHQLVCETNPGLGLVAKELLQNGLKRIRLFEYSLHFQKYLNTNFDPAHIELIDKDLFSLHYYAYRDTTDNGNRVKTMLSNVPKRDWTDEPVMTIVGTMSSLNFIQYLFRSLVLNTTIMKFGRIQIFAIMRPRDYAKLTATPNDNLYAYRNLTVLFQTFFECELLRTFPRKLFLPWQKPMAPRLLLNYPYNLDIQHMYFVKITCKKDFPIPRENALEFYAFMKRLYAFGRTKVIPTVESWVPDCGFEMLATDVTKCKDHFEDMGIFTTFGELNPAQILNVFKQMLNHPNYDASPFPGMVEQHILRTETIDSDLHDALNKKKT